MNCNRKGKFNWMELHKCFVKGCIDLFYPGVNETCEICNWKKCNNGHCGCSLSKETRDVLDSFYDLFCNPNDYSDETKFGLRIMLDTYYKECKDCID